MEFEKEIKDELKKRGLDVKLAEKINVEKEDEIQDAVYNLKLEVEIEKIKDKAVNDAIKTRESNLRKTIESELKKKAEADKLEADKKAKETPKEQEFAQTVQDAIDKVFKPFSEKLEKLESKENARTLQGRKEAALKEAKLDERYLKYVKGDTEDEIAESIKTLKEDFVTELQAKSNEAIANVTPPVQSEAEVKSSSAEISGYLDRKKAEMDTNNIVKTLEV